jgi:molybdopterin molybdotransferase
MIPDGADAVVMVEYSEKLDDHTVAVYKAGSPGSGLTEAGDDFRRGELLFRQGHRIREKDVGVLAALGLTKLPVYCPPRVSVFSTGDEIIPAAQSPEPGEIRDINRHGLLSLLASIGVQTAADDTRQTSGDSGMSSRTLANDAQNTAIRPIVKDDEADLAQNLQNCLKQSDIVILSGGSSAGNKDMTAQIIDGAGKPGVITHGLAMKPGKPTIIGVVDGKIIFGLPGHPAAALLVFKAVVEPFIQKYYFGCTERAIRVNAVLTENVHAGEGRETFLLVRLTEARDASGRMIDGSRAENGHAPDARSDFWLAEPIHAKSGAISQIARADGYVRIPSLSEGVNQGERVQVVLL